MKAKEIKDLYKEGEKLSAEAMTLVYDKSNGTWATGLRNIQEAIGVSIDGVAINTTVDESKLANSDNQAEIELKSYSSGDYGTHKSYEINAKLPKIVSVSELETREIPAGSEELLQGGNKITVHTSDESLVSAKSIIVKDGISISSIVPKALTYISGDKNIYTINFSNGTSTDIQVVNGRAGWGIEKTYDISKKDEVEAEGSDNLASTDDVPVGSFVILTGDVENPDTSRLYLKKGEYQGLDSLQNPIYTNLKYQYITDLSGAQGIQGIGIKSITTAYESTESYDPNITNTVTVDEKEFEIEQGANLLKVEFKNDSPTTQTPENTYFKIRNGKEINFAQEQETSIKQISSTEQPKVSITVNRDSPVSEKELSFDFEIPMAQGISNIEIEQNNTQGESSTVKIGYGNVTLEEKEVDGEIKSVRTAEHEEELKIYNGHDGYGYFELQLSEDGHLYKYYQNGKESPEFEIGDDGHLYALLDSGEIVKKDLGLINKESTGVLVVDDIPEDSINTVYIVKDFLEVTEE